MACAECDRLSTELERLERIYARALGVLRENANDGSTAEYQRLSAATYETRIDADVARIELERHQRTHTKAN